MLFSDLVGFTSMSEQMSPEELVALLNTYFEQATGVLMEIRGCPADEALALLSGTGRAQRRALEDVAAELVGVAGPVRG